MRLVWSCLSLRLFGLRLRHHDVLGCTRCFYHRELDELLCIQLEVSSLLLAVIIALIKSCLITPPCYELSMKERGEDYLSNFLRVRGVARIRDVGCAHPGFALYFARIRCPNVRCAHP